MRIRYWFLLSVLLTILASCVNFKENSGGFQKQTLRLILRLDQPVYHVSQPIIATVTLQNIGDKFVVINSRLSINLPSIGSPIREIAFDIIAPSGEYYSPDIIIDNRPLRKTDFVDIRPMGTIEHTYYLTSYGYKFTEVGVYKVTANYQNLVDPISIDSEDHRTAWKGELNSNTIVITVIP